MDVLSQQEHEPKGSAPREWFFLPGLTIGAGWLLSQLVLPYVSVQRRLVALIALAVLVTVLGVLGRRVHRAGRLLTRGTALLALVCLGLSAFYVRTALDRRIDRDGICRQASAPISTADDLERIQRGTIGEYVEAESNSAALDGDRSLFANALGLGTNAFMVAQEVRSRPGGRTTPQEQEELRAQQAALAATCR